MSDRWTQAEIDEAKRRGDELAAWLNGLVNDEGDAANFRVDPDDAGSQP